MEYWNDKFVFDSNASVKIIDNKEDNGEDEKFLGDNADNVNIGDVIWDGWEIISEVDGDNDKAISD